jgi:hypothetical protein
LLAVAIALSGPLRRARRLTVAGYRANASGRPATWPGRVLGEVKPRERLNGRAGRARQRNVAATYRALR